MPPARLVLELASLGPSPDCLQVGRPASESLAVTVASLASLADDSGHWDPDFAAYYGVRYAHGCHHNLILGARARKMAVRIYVRMRRREQHVADGTTDAPTYVLRNAQGEFISKSEARQLIQTTHTRSVFAPERANKAKARKAVPADFAQPKAAEATASAPPPTATTPAPMSVSMLVSAPTLPTADPPERVSISGNRGLPAPDFADDFLAPVLV